MYNIDNDFTPLQPQHTLLQNAKGAKDQKNLRGYESLIANKTQGVVGSVLPIKNA